MSFPDVASPDVIYHYPAYYTTWPAGGVVDGISYNSVIMRPGTHFFKASTMPGSVYIGTNVNVVAWITGNISFTGLDRVTIVAEGGSLTVFAEGTFSTSDSASIYNLSQLARNFTLFGRTNCTAISIAGGTNLTGTIYAPQANLSFANALSNYNFTGCIMAKNVTLSGHLEFHADESAYRGSPLIFSAPQDQAVLVGQNAAFGASVLGSRPLGFQWEFGIGDILDASNSSLTLTNVQLADAGTYSLVITNFFGSVTSAPALLQVFESAAGTLQSPSFAGNNQFQLTVSGVPGFNYVVETSTNLFDWTPLLTNAAPFTLTDTNVVNVPRRFYRSVYFP